MKENKTNINCEEWTNAKLPKSAQKWTLYKFSIFRDLLKLTINPSSSTEIK